MHIFVLALCLTLLLFLPLSAAITLKEYYSHPPRPVAEKTPNYLPQYKQSSQFRPSTFIYAKTTDTQNDLFRLVQQHIKYPYQTISPSEIAWVRKYRETIYHPFLKKTVWTQTLTDTDLQKLLIRPDVRNAVGLPALSPFQPHT